MEIIENALNEGLSSLSEYQSKLILSEYNIPVTKEVIVKDENELNESVKKIGYPLVLKGCSSQIANKTEHGLLKIDFRNDHEARDAFNGIMGKMNGQDKSVLVQKMIKGQRELVIGMTHDDQFGPYVMFGLEGVFTEILKDVAFQVAPLERKDAMDLMQSIKAKKILENVRGIKMVDREVLADILVAVGQIAMVHDQIQEIDINPLKITDGKPIAVDALVVLDSNKP